LSQTFSTAEVARILRMREPRIRELVRSGLCRPTREGRRYAFDFQDLVVLRTALALIDARVPASRVHRALLALHEALPADRSLAGLRIHADGRQVVVRDAGGRWNPETGQALLDFGTDELAERVRSVREHPAARTSTPPEARAQDEFERALELEEGDPRAARAAYARALELDPELVDAYVNLGRLLHQAGEPREATRLYHGALARTPDDPVVHFNLALALEDVDGPSPAISHYERALELDPSFADAHYNLAGLCEQVERYSDALRHYQAYKKLTAG